MIKIKLRKNLIYLFIYYISWYIRKILNIIVEETFKASISYIYLYLINFTEIFGGLSICLYQYFLQSQSKQTKNFSINYDKKQKIDD